MQEVHSLGRVRQASGQQRVAPEEAGLAAFVNPVEERRSMRPIVDDEVTIVARQRTLVA